MVATGLFHSKEFTDMHIIFADTDPLAPNPTVTGDDTQDTPSLDSALAKASERVRAIAAPITRLQAAIESQIAMVVAECTPGLSQRTIDLITLHAPSFPMTEQMENRIRSASLISVPASVWIASVEKGNYIHAPDEFLSELRRKLTLYFMDDPSRSTNNRIRKMQERIRDLRVGYQEARDWQDQIENMQATLRVGEPVVTITTLAHHTAEQAADELPELLLTADMELSGDGE